MASLLTHFLNGMFKRMPIIEDPELERRQNAALPLAKPPRGIAVEDARLGVPCELISGKGSGEPVILNIHGGGFTTGSKEQTRAFSFALCKLLKCKVLAPDYRLAPEHKLPASFDDCFEVYKRAIKVYPRLILVGGSAGGTLALATALRAKEEGLPLPAAVAAISPLAGIGMQLPSHQTNLATDYMLKRDPSGGALLQKLIPEGAGEDFLKDPKISPVYGDFAGFPPLFLAASDSEILFDDSKLLFKTAKAAGVKCFFLIGHKQLHAWASIPQIPEARSALKQMRTFLQREGVLKKS